MTCVSADRLRLWRNEPDAMVRELFRIEPDPWQTQALRAFPHKKRLAIYACKGPGKTALESWIFWNFMLTRPHPHVVCTSISKDNLRDNLWTEVAKWHEKSPVLAREFKWTGTRVVHRKHWKTWWASARAWARDADTEQQANTLSGLHGDYMLYIGDEAGGYPDSVVAAAEGILAVGKEAHLLLAGNPTHLSGPLYRSNTVERPLWWVLHVTGDPDDPNRAPRVDRQWALDQIFKYGRESSWVQVNVFGHFPKGATDALISLSDFEDAYARWPGIGLAREPKILSLDVARLGNDQNVVYWREGDLLVRRESWQGQDTVYTAGRVADYFRDFVGCTGVHVDDIGVGGGVVDQLRAMKVFGHDGRERRIPVRGIDVGSRQTMTKDDQAVHSNLKSLLNLNMQERFRAGLIAIAPVIRDHTTLAAEGTNIKVKFAHGSSRRIIESKEEYRRRTGASPDDWDSVVLAFAPASVASVSKPRKDERHAIFDAKY